MLFNSIEFAIFLPIVFLLYWFVFQKNLRWQNLFIVFVSYVFYGWWDWRFLFLIVFSTVQDFAVSYWMSKEENERKRKLLLAVSVITNLGFLGFFKYYNFFVENLYIPDIELYDRCLQKKSRGYQGLYCFFCVCKLLSSASGRAY